MTGEFDFAALFQRPEFREMYAQRSGAHGDLGIEIVDAVPERVCIQIPFRPELVRSIINPSMHAGVVMTAMDSGMGLVTMMNLKEPSSLATLDLRYDELRSPLAGEGIEIAALCESIDDGIVLLTSTASDAEGVFAKAVGRFFLTGASSDFLQTALEMLASQPDGESSVVGGAS